MALSPTWLWDIVAFLHLKSSELKNGLLNGVNLAHMWDAAKFGSLHQSFILPLLEASEIAFKLEETAVQAKLQTCLEDNYDNRTVSHGDADKHMGASSDATMVSFEQSAIIPRYHDPDLAPMQGIRKRRSGTAGNPSALVRATRKNPQTPLSPTKAALLPLLGMLWLFPSLLPASAPIDLADLWNSNS